MRIEVIGAGSLGLLFAARLANAGNAVTLVTRTEEQRAKIIQDGVTVSGLTNLLHVQVGVEVFPSSTEAEQARADWVFLTVKQPDLTAGFRKGLQARLDSSSSLLLFQNGIGHADKLNGLVPDDRLYVAITTEGAHRLSPVGVAHTGVGDTWLGHANGSPLSDQSTHGERSLLEALMAAGFRSHLSNDIRSKVWEKLILNAVVNPLTSVLKVSNGELLASPVRIRFMKRLYDEAAGLAEKLGAAVPPGLWERVLEVCRATAANYSSMLQDTLAGRSTELEAITGSLLRLAQEVGMALPTHEMLYELVLCLGSDSPDPPNLDH